VRSGLVIPGLTRDLIPPNRRKAIGLLAPIRGGLFAPTPDFGPCRRTIGPTVRVRPIILRLADGKEQEDVTVGQEWDNM